MILPTLASGFLGFKPPGLEESGLNRAGNISNKFEILNAENAGGQKEYY